MTLFHHLSGDILPACERTEKTKALPAITLINPHLNVMYISSHEIEQKINRLKGHSLSYSDYPLKNIVLSEGLSEYTVNLMNGENLFFLLADINLLL